MGSNFFAAGGFGMYPVSVFGALSIVASVLYALRLQPKAARLAATFGAVTLASGLLGTYTGVCNSMRYIQQVERPRQLEIMALGIEESLHVVILALALAVLAGLIAAAGTLRAPAGSLGAE